MQALGARVHIITEPDPVSGLLGARMSYIEELCASDERYVWLNQYTNANAWMAHYRTPPRRSLRSSRIWTCCSSGPARPGR